MHELLNKCNHDQLVQFARDCAKHAAKYAESVEGVDMYAEYAELADMYAEYAEFVEVAAEFAEDAAEHARNAAKYTGIGREVERQRQTEFLTIMLEQDK